MILRGGQGGAVAGANRGGAVAAFVLCAFLVGCAEPLPDADSSPAKLYARECGVCHVAYAPHLLKPAMWEMQMGRMADIRRRRGLPPLSAADRKVILDYLARYAG